MVDEIVLQPVRYLGLIEGKDSLYSVGLKATALMFVFVPVLLRLLHPRIVQADIAVLIGPLVDQTSNNGASMMMDCHRQICHMM